MVSKLVRPWVAGRPPTPDAHEVPAPSAIATPPIVFEAVSKRFPTQQGDVQALCAIDLAIPARSIFGIIGRSGAGKSTLIRLINRLERPDVGRVFVNGVDLAGLDEAGLARFRRRTGMIFQHFNLLSAKTVQGNVALPLLAAGIPARQAERRVAELLDLVGLVDKRESYPAQLSGGQKQRVGIARALVHEPDILLCDEATSALDPETTQSILALLRDINQRLGLTIVLITHEMAVIREICDRVAVLQSGELVEDGEVWRVLGAPRHAATRALLRPLAHDLPGELAGRVLASPPDGPHVTVLALGFDGAGPDPALGALTGLLGASMRLLHGGVDRIQDRAQGRLIVSADLDAASLTPALAALRNLAQSVEIIGYVAVPA